MDRRDGRSGGNLVWDGAWAVAVVPFVVVVVVDDDDDG